MYTVRRQRQDHSERDAGGVRSVRPAHAGRPDAAADESLRHGPERHARGYDADVKGYDADVKGYDADVKGYDADVKGYDADVKGYDTDRNGTLELGELMRVFHPASSIYRPIHD
eukprot:1179606-Prorocentrum_minimum.AAC.2